VKLDGEVWEARGPAGVLLGEEVVVIAVDGLVLDVEPVS
jgi:membrane protein implicated in regulation of membrane protease activity